MGLIGKIWVRLGLDNSEYKRGIKDTEKQTDQFSAGIKRMGAALLAAFSIQKIMQWGAAAIKAYNEQAIAVAKLESVLKSTGNAAGLTSKELQRYATELQKTTMFGDEATLEAMARLATFKSISKDIFKATIASAQDLATVMGGDLNGAILQLGKALEAPEIGLTMLRRSGVSFSTEQIEQIKKLVAEGKKHEAQLVMLAEVQSQFGGAAKAAANTAAGAWKVAGNALGDLMETIGSGVEGTKQMAKNLTVVMTDLNDLLSNENLSRWEKFKGLFSSTERQKGAELQSRADIYEREREKRVSAFMAEYVKSVDDANRELELLKTKNPFGYDLKLLGQLREQLKSYIKDITQAVAIQEGLIPTLKEQIKVKEELRDFETDPLRLRILNDEIARMNERLKVLQMTTEEYKKYTEVQGRTALGPTLPQGGTITQPQVVSSQDPFKGAAYGYLTAQGENIANQVKAQNDKLEQEQARAEQIAQGFQNAFVNILGNSIEQLTSIIAGTEKLNTGQVVATLLMPLADMAITAGGIILTTGTAIESLKASLVAFFGGSAIAAGAALIAVGAAAKIGLKSLATGSTQSAGSSTSFTGGSAPIQFKPMESVELYSVIKGSDIYLSSKNYQQSRGR